MSATDLTILGALGLIATSALVLWLVRAIDKGTEATSDAGRVAAILAECEECGHRMGDHDKYGHCEDECPCRLCDWETCLSSACFTRRLAKSEYERAKTHDRASCPCACCKFLRTRA